MCGQANDPHEELMRRAIELGALGKGTTSPNPRVGALVLKDGAVVGEGYHKRAGEDHAEVIALRAAGERAMGATLIVTLEPCSTARRTPPCTNAILEAGIAEVIYGIEDVYPDHAGRGLAMLRENGVRVIGPVLAAECEALNEGWPGFVLDGLPFVTVKAGLSLDGKLATTTGESQWITNELSRAHVHRMRYETDAVVVGLGTVKKDDPQMTPRGDFAETRCPWRIIVDGAAAMPLDARVLTDEWTSRTIVVTTKDAPEHQREMIAETGAEVLAIDGDLDNVNLRDLMLRLADRGIVYIMIEGGSKVFTSAFEQGIVDKVALFYAPILIGGHDAPSLMAGRGISTLDDAITLKNVTTTRFGDDVLIEARVQQ
ncbi:MAG: bifunctional diaminohydroxyphosphoribosylaminopyrimidine deaminase/5-amino-6-(5-phosphoribosylamino)uracil reductase RibD [Verrucomicrobia bacterium]|nr:bifunctional diaminohydroxyphosphoribosylaminopyrimidine deaminase/5-amino-6-(5-phosphoribosylamino)uracil reductase RibD [Verrucomicrobiota bacterium]